VLPDAMASSLFFSFLFFSFSSFSVQGNQWVRKKVAKKQIVELSIF
jgi:hypothetical protein